MQIRKPQESDSTFFFVDAPRTFVFLSLYMARIYSLRRKSTLALRQRKEHLLSQFKIHPDLLRASFVERFSVCGKKNCRCRQGGDKHGPFYYLTQCLAVGAVAKFLLKTQLQQQLDPLRRQVEEQARRAGREDILQHLPNATDFNQLNQWLSELR